MQIMKKIALLAVAVSAVTLTAAPWAALGPKRKPETLVIVSNYKSPRLMAELIQYESRAPYVLLPVNGTADGRIFFCPPKKTSIQIPEARFNAFIRFLNPKRIVVIGSDLYVNKKYVDMLDRTIPVVRIDGADWNRIADELNFLLNLSHLDTNFKRLHETMLNDGSIYRPVSLPDGKREAKDNVVPAAENAAPEQKEAPAAEAPAADVPAPAAAPAA